MEHWALPKEKKFPIETVDQVKLAAYAFDEQLENMSVAQRLVAARHICDRASELNVDVGAHKAYKYASANLNPQISALINMRKEATAHLHDEELDMCVKIAHVAASKDVNQRVAALDKLAMAIADFDERNGLVGHWNSWMPDPAYTVYGQHLDTDKDLTRVVKVASFEIREETLANADWSKFEGRLEDEVIQGLSDAGDKLSVFDSLPTPHKEIITQGLMIEE